MDSFKYWTQGHVVCENTTKLLDNVSEFNASHQELVSNPSLFERPSEDEFYIKNGPLRECRSAHMIASKQVARDKSPSWLQNALVDKRTGSFHHNNNHLSQTYLLLNHLKHIIDPTNQRLVTHAYATYLSPGKQIYPHSDTIGDYWPRINRYQFYYTGNSKVRQVINDTVFPVSPGDLYHFDFRQIHHYVNESSENLLIMIFDLLKLIEVEG